MKLSKISVIAAMVLGGLVAGSTMVRAADATDSSGKGKGKGNRMTVEQTLDKLTTELTLTDAQKPTKVLFVNGCLGHGIDWDDTHLEALLHPTANSKE